MTKQNGFYGWKLVGVLWLLYLVNMGFAFYGGFVANTYMLKDVPMDRTAFGFGVTLMVMAAGLPSTLIAASINKLGARLTLVLGSALIAMMMDARIAAHHDLARGLGESLLLPVGGALCATLCALLFRNFPPIGGSVSAGSAGAGGPES